MAVLVALALGAAGARVFAGVIARLLNFELTSQSVPLGVLQAGGVVFDPPLDPRVRGAMDRLGMGTYDKVFLRFPSRFWGDDWVLRQQGPAGVDFHSWYDMSRVTGEPVLAALLGGTGARRVEELPDVMIVDEAVTALRRMFGDVPAPESWRITRWATTSGYRRMGEVPMYRITKTPKLARRQGAYAVVSAHGMILKRGHDLSTVLRVFERKRHLSVVSG